MNSTTISRRKFLKSGGLALAGAGLAYCGINLARPIPDTSDLQLPSYEFGESIMKKPLLITYASAYGSTAEVAAEIGKTIAKRGISVQVKPVNEDIKLDEYQAVLIGSAVQHGSWLSEALDFVRTNQQILRNMPVALFCVHITNLGNNPQERQNRLSFLEAPRQLIKAFDEAYFAGKIDRRSAAHLMPALLARILPPIDFRNWKKIRSWAERLDLTRYVE